MQRDALQRDVDELMRDYAGDGPGASVLVLRDGEAVVRRGYGYADLEAGVRAAPRTNYRLASVSKQFTAAAMLLLAEDGKLRLDDPVRKWLPALPGRPPRHHAAPPAHPHLGPGRLRRPDGARGDRAGPRRRRAAPARSTGPRFTSRRAATIATATAAMRCWRWSSSGVRQALRTLPARAHLRAARHDAHRRVRGRRLHRRDRAYGYSFERRRLAAHRPELHQRGARRRRHLLVDRRPGEMGRGAVRRSPARDAVARARLHARRRKTDDPAVEVRLRLAHHTAKCYGIPAKPSASAT